MNKDSYIRSMIEVGKLPENVDLPRILTALRRTRRKNVFEMFGFLSAKVVRANGAQENLGLVGCQLVTTAFANCLVDAMVNQTTQPIDTFKYHASGTNGAAEANSQAALGVEVEARVAGNQAEGASPNIYKSVGTSNYTANRTITEHGLFSNSTGAVLLDRTLLANSIGVDANDQIEWTYQLTVNAEA